MKEISYRKLSLTTTSHIHFPSSASHLYMLLGAGTSLKTNAQSSWDIWYMYVDREGRAVIAAR